MMLSPFAKTFTRSLLNFAFSLCTQPNLDGISMTFLICPKNQLSLRFQSAITFFKSQPTKGMSSVGHKLFAKLSAAHFTEMIKTGGLTGFC